MERQRFDRLVRAIASHSSRRSALAGLAGGVAALAWTGGDRAQAKKNKRKRCRCRPNCTGKVCGDNGCGGTCGTCAQGQPFCCNGACRRECCGDVQCASGETCLRGACVTPCAIDRNCPPTAPICCNGGCVDTNTDRGNCGGCGIPCNPPANCFNGECALG